MKWYFSVGILNLMTAVTVSIATITEYFEMGSFNTVQRAKKKINKLLCLMLYLLYMHFACVADQHTLPLHLKIPVSS